MTNTYPNTYPKFQAGQKVRDVYGRSWTVRDQWDCVVRVEGGRWFHPTKLFPV